jgi:methionyl-tRNA formyltransferase
MQMDEGLDTGDMLLVERVPIGADDSTATLHDKLATLGGRLIVEALEAAACGGLQPRPQPADGVSYARKIDKAEAAIDWHQAAAEIERRIRAFDPQPGCHADVGGEPLKIWRAKVSAGFSGEVGQLAVEAGRAIVACAQGGLELLEVQRPGGRRLGAAAWLASRS